MITTQPMAYMAVLGSSQGDVIYGFFGGTFMVTVLISV